jgi:hypothetical protein
MDKNDYKKNFEAVKTHTGKEVEMQGGPLTGLKVDPCWDNLTTVKMRLHRARRMLEMVMECGCAVSNDAFGLPVCQPKPGVLPPSDKLANRKK